LFSPYPWKWFITATFCSAHDAPRRNGAISDYVLNGAGIALAVEDKGFRNTCRHHFHLLLQTNSSRPGYCFSKKRQRHPLAECCWSHRWVFGHSKVLPYDHTRGAVFYLGRHIVRHGRDWTLILKDDAISCGTGFLTPSASVPQLGKC
jgi:hypothetical protein